MFFGGHTVTFGNTTSFIGNVSVVVVTGLSAQLSNDILIRIPAVVNPEMTVMIQNNCTDRLVVDM